MIEKTELFKAKKHTRMLMYKKSFIKGGYCLTVTYTKDTKSAHAFT